MARNSYDQQRKDLERMLQNPEKALKSLDPSPRAGKPTNSEDSQAKHSISSISTYTTGSTAAAGSGEFHILKHQRRAAHEEHEKEKMEVQKELEATEFERKRRELEELDEAKTLRNRKRRRRQRDKIKGGHNSAGKEGESRGKPVGPAGPESKSVQDNDIPVSISGPISMNSNSDKSDSESQTTSKPLTKPVEPSLNIIDDDEF